MNQVNVSGEGQPGRFSLFMASKAGRALRVALGAALRGAGVFAVEGWAGIALAAAGVVPIVTGALNLCPVAPLWGGHFLGAKYCAARPPKR
ncbi:DUF2892 domain-containing protein [Tepidiforma sp.]|uniref:YgaP family membrane protein n=1 Tax=Tepidiforma sp. TaxID=2682230 RepID=UPI002ADE6170|nr:DUF2892 domain-containing protein [Tepidiforma sp.]